VNKKIIVAVAVLIVAFLAGFLPQYAKVARLERELGEAGRESSMAQLRDLAGLAYLQASQKDYGLAGSTTTLFFDRTREVANQTPDSSGRKLLEDLLNVRDQITGELARADPGVLTDLQTLFVEDSPGNSRLRRCPATRMMPLQMEIKSSGESSCQDAHAAPALASLSRVVIKTA